MLSVANTAIMLSVIMLNVIMLSVVALPYSPLLDSVLKTFKYQMHKKSFLPHR